MPTTAQETFRPAFPPSTRPSISTGLPFPAACAHHIEHTLHASRVYITVSKSISQTSDFTDLKEALGEKVVGFWKGIRPHTPWDDVLEIVEECRNLDADAIVTLGAGSLTDGAKIISLALANDVDSLDGMSILARNASKKSVMPCRVPIINIPTSLSGGEYQSFGGATDLQDNHKVLFYNPSMGSEIVILSPTLCFTTPEDIWLSTGVRAIDHCVESVCILEKNATEETNASALKALKMLVPALLVTKRDPRNEEARMQEMMAVVEVMKVLKAGIPMGGSHGIGHQLGPLHVGHGVTSCIMLPAVSKYNFQHGDEKVRAKQQMCLDALWDEKTVAEMLKKRGLKKEMADLGDVIDAIVREFGQPRTLAEVGVHRSQLDKLAQNCLKDAWLKTNAVPLVKKEQVMEILEMVVGESKRSVL